MAWQAQEGLKKLSRICDGERKRYLSAVILFRFELMHMALMLQGPLPQYNEVPDRRHAHFLPNFMRFSFPSSE